MLRSWETQQWTGIPSKREKKYSHLIHVTDTRINSGCFAQVTHVDIAFLQITSSYRNYCHTIMFITFSPALIIASKLGHLSLWRNNIEPNRETCLDPVLSKECVAINTYKRVNE